MMSLEELIDRSGDSIIEGYTYSDGILNIALYIAELEKKLKISIRTETMSFNSYYLQQKNIVYRTCRIEVQVLLDILSVNHNIYIPSNIFGKLMNETKLNYNLAYGKKISEMKYIFSLVGYDRLLSCVFTDLNSIEFKEFL